MPPFDLAILHAALGERADASTTLEKAYEERNGLLWYRIHMPAYRTRSATSPAGGRSPTSSPGPLRSSVVADPTRN